MVPADAVVTVDVTPGYAGFVVEVDPDRRDEACEFGSAALDVALPGCDVIDAVASEQGIDVPSARSSAARISTSERLPVSNSRT